MKGLTMWLRDTFGRSPSTARADHAITVATDVADSSRSLREQLQPFNAETDPFTAIFVKQGMAHVFEEDIEFRKTPRVRP